MRFVSSLAVLAAAAFLWFSVIAPTTAPSRAEDPSAQADLPLSGSGIRAAQASDNDPAAALRGAAALAHQDLARSLRGTDVDGHLAADENGDLVVTLSVRDFFDYFLSTVGEVPLAEVVAFMEQYARARLPASAADQLMALLEDYMGYRQAAAQLYQKPLKAVEQQTPEYYLETLEQTFGDLRDLRRAHLGEGAASALFGLEEEYGQYTLDRMAVQLDRTLSMAERDQQLAELRAELSPMLAASEQEQVAQVERAQHTEDIVRSSADESEMRAALAEYHQPEHVDRIVAHADRKQTFAARMDQYLTARNELLATGVASAERDRMVAELRQRHFPDQQELIWARTREARADRQSDGQF